MARFSASYRAFVAGEWSPKLHGRSDLELYKSAAKELFNMLPLPQGGAINRTGTHYVAATKSNAVGRLIPFEFSTEQAYIIEATAGFFRFYKDRAQILSGPPYEIANPYALADLAGLRWTQSADTMWLCHPLYQPRLLSRTGHAAWSLSLFAFQDGPYLDVNATATTLAMSAGSGSVTVTASGTAGINGGVGFLATDVGRHIRHLQTTWGWLEITAWTSSTVVTALWKRSSSGFSATANWRLGAWCPTLGYPAVAVFWQGRLWFGRTTSQPQTVWGSASGNFISFAPTLAGVTAVTDADAITATIDDDRVNAIMYLQPGRALIIGTTGGELMGQASTQQEAVSPANFTIRPGSTKGASDLQPVRIDNATLYAQRARRKLNESVYDANIEGFASRNVSIHADHLLRRQLKELAYQREPWGVIWAVMDDGSLLGFTYLTEFDVTAWGQHAIAGTAAKVLSIAVIPGTTQDELWLLVERTINGATARYVEYLEYEFAPANADDKDGAFYVDAGMTYAGAPTASLVGLTHLIGETVAILGDGATHPTKVVSAGGTVTLDREVSAASVGLPYQSRLQTLSLEEGARDGDALGKPKRIFKMAIRFVDTLGAKYGASLDALEEVIFRKGSDPMDASPPLFTGVKMVGFPGESEREVGVIVVQDQPLPMMVTALAPAVNVVES